MRIFKTFLGWSEVIFLFSDDISFNEIKNNPKTGILTKKEYIGQQDFIEEYLKLFDIEYINNKKYYYKFCYRNDPRPVEELTTWRKI